MRRAYSMVKKNVSTYSITVSMSLRVLLMAGRVSMKATIRLSTMAIMTDKSNAFPAGVFDSPTILYRRCLSLNSSNIFFMLNNTILSLLFNVQEGHGCHAEPVRFPVFAGKVTYFILDIKGTGRNKVCIDEKYGFLHKVFLRVQWIGAFITQSG